MERRASALIEWLRRQAPVEAFLVGLVLGYLACYLASHLG